MFVTDEILNLWISSGSYFDINGLLFSKEDARSVSRWNLSTVMGCMECSKKLNGFDGFDSKIWYIKECNGDVGCNATNIFPVL